MTDGLARSRKVYVDANVSIYFVEGDEGFKRLAQRAMVIAAKHRIALVSSELTYAECLYGVIKNGRTELESKYRQMFIAGGLIQLASINFTLLDRAARLGGETGLKLFDSIHMVTAIETGCDTYLTNDKRFRDATGLRVMLLPDIGD